MMSLSLLSVMVASLWITPKGASSPEANVAVFCREVSVGKPLARAEWRVTALGAFEAKVNGRVVSRFLDPGFTQPEKTRYEVSYDVTDALRTGANRLEAAVAPTWWRCRMMRRAYPKVGEPNPTRSALRATLALTYRDGTKEEVGTDGSWLSAYTGPVTDAGVFEGERYDAGKPVSGLAASVPCDDFRGEVVPRRGPPVLLREDLLLKPQAAYVWRGVSDAKGTNEFGKVVVRRRYRCGEPMDLRPGETLVLDFGQNASAIPRLTLEGPAGAALTVKMCEMLNDSNGERARRCDGPAGSAMLANLRSATADLRYVCREGRQDYAPHFTFFGYRYASLTATQPIRILSAESVPVSSLSRDAESPCLVTGNEKVNRLVENIRWGFRSNYLEVPTDCPQRDERLGWTADTMAFVSAAAYSADVRDFLGKWLKDLRDCQGADGAFATLAPLVWGFHGYGAVTGWSDAGVLVPHCLWKRYGDRALLDEHWTAMTRYMDFLAAHHGPDKQYYGDWQAFEHSFVEPGGVNLSSPERYRECFRGFFFVWDALAMKEMAQDLGKTEEARRYEALERLARKEFADKYMGADGLMDPYYRGQTTDLFLLKLGLVEGAAHEKVKAHLVADIRAHGGCLQTGFLGTMILMETLSEAGLTDVAYDLLFQEKCPSWLFSVNNGATTVWERWDCYDPAKGFQDPGMNSFNHYSYGAVYAWMMSTVAGIRTDPASPGMRHFVLAPQPDERLGFARAAYDAPCGRIESEWKCADGTCVWRFRIPAGASATVRVPGQADRECAAGEHTLTFAAGGRATTASPEELFAHPPHAADVGVWWHWMGSAVTEAGIVRDLDYFKSAGIGFATVFAIADTVTPHPSEVGLGPFRKVVAFTPEWFRLLKFACAEARKRGIEIGLHNSPGYTSTGGPWMPARLAMRKLVFNPVGKKDVDLVDIGTIGGVRLAHASLGSVNSPAQPEATGLECDKLNAEAVAFHCDHVLGELKRHLGDEFGRGLTYVHLDSYEAGKATWTPKMREEFKVRKGYDCLPFLPALGGFKVALADDKVAAFRRDYEEVLKDLYRDNLFRILGEKIRGAGLRFTCEPYSGPFRIEDGIAASDIPMDELWFNRRPRTYPPVRWNRLAGPDGRRHNVVEIEAFTGNPEQTGWTERLDEIKAVGDVMLLRGFNRFFLHSCPLQPFADDVRPGMTMGRWGTHFGRTQTWAQPATNAWFAYQRRCQALLQWGEPSDDTLAAAEAVRSCARTDGRRTLHFVVNASETNVAWTGEGRWFDPVSGTVGSAPQTLAPRQSGFFEAVRTDRPPCFGAPSGRSVAEVRGPWRLEFAGGGYLAKTELFDWTTSVDKDVKYFSGTGLYRTSFDLAASALAADRLDLGETLGHVSEVTLNGRFLGTVWTAPWSVRVPKGLLKEKDNRLEIRYTNVWANRLVGDEQLADDCSWKSAGAWTGWSPVVWPEWSVRSVRERPEKGRKTYCSWKHYTADGKLVPSGLLGPVTLYADSSDRCVAAEAPEAFKAEFDCVHRPHLRDAALCPASDEFAFEDGVTVTALSTNALVRRAAADFADYLTVSMGVAATVGEKGTIVVSLEDALASRSCEIAVAKSGVTVRAADGRAAMQALFHLEDLMNLRRAPFLKVGTESRREKYETRMVHSGYGTDVFPDGYLGQIAHAGFGAILFYIDREGVTRAGKTDVGELIDRAEAWGLGAYLYSALKAKVHPDDPKSTEVFDRTYGAVGRAYPKAKGIVCVPESCEFPSRDPRAKQFSPRFPTSDYPLWSAAAEKAFRQGNPDADFIFWTYNFCWYPDKDRCAFIRNVTPTTAINVTFAVGGGLPEHVTQTGRGFPIEDYSICEPGPSALFTCEARAAKERGLRLFTMVNTAGRTWDFGCCPYEPVPQAWKRRYDAIEAARRAYGIVGLMESHHYGFAPNVIAELSKEAFVEGGIPFDRHLRAIAARDFGETHADEVVAVWADLSEAIRAYVATGANQYGPFRVGPAFPFNCYGKTIRPTDIPGWSGWICNPNYGWNIPWSGGESRPANLDVAHIRDELALFRPAAERFLAGATRLRGFAEGLSGERRKRAIREAGVVEYVGRSFLTCANVKEATLAERAGERDKVLRLAREEYANACASLPLVDGDSRLGWEPSMRYRGGRPQIEWKLRRMEELYDLPRASANERR